MTAEHLNIRSEKREGRLRALAVVSRFKWQHIDYLAALAEQFALTVAWAGEEHPGVVVHATRVGLQLCSLGLTEKDGVKAVRSRLSQAILECQPDVVHLIYYFHEHLVLLAKQLADRNTLILFECRDPLTTLVATQVRPRYSNLEGAALRLSDA
ncbi:MAG TPA: hypothetical protein VLX11_06890, partial [Candidatus Acidoferrales bacterium]|nr:hypothetical protein [Candidatus Acidoferrales bacterium]